MNGFPQVRLIRSQEEQGRVIAAARADRDNIVQPSHVSLRGEKIVGAVSMGAVPLVLVWNHTTEIGPRDSLHLKQIYDSVMDAKGFSTYYIACNKHSPYNAHMKRLGFTPIWETEIFTGGTG